jgi:hypothetical protein
VGKTTAFPRESQNSKSNAWDVDDENRDENDVLYTLSDNLPRNRRSEPPLNRHRYKLSKPLLSVAGRGDVRISD